MAPFRHSKETLARSGFLEGAGGTFGRARLPLPSQLSPYLARSVPPSAFIVDATDRRKGFGVLFWTDKRLFRGRGRRRHTHNRSTERSAKRGGPARLRSLAMLFDERDHLRNVR